MDRENPPPPVEEQYEGPHPVEQRMWNQSIYATVLIVAIVFVVIVVAVMIAL
ncbi:MAG: hypothetical protein AB7V46_02420 [Thermomicrobiales bacterium]